MYMHPLVNVSKDSTDIEELRELITAVVYQFTFSSRRGPNWCIVATSDSPLKLDPHSGWCSVEDCVKIAEFCNISREALLKENGILGYLHDRFGSILFYRKVVGLCLRVIVNANTIMGPPSELFVHVLGNVYKPGNSYSRIKKKKVHKTDDTISTNKRSCLLHASCALS